MIRELCVRQLFIQGVQIIIDTFNFISLVFGGACLLRSKISKLWKDDIEVSMEYGESFMSTENCVKLMFLRLCKEFMFLITLGVFMLIIK